MSLKEGLKKIGKDAVNSVLGRTETALLLVEDYRETAKEAVMEEKNGVAGALKNLSDKMAGNLKKLAGREGAAEGAVRREFAVQFNPDRLSVSSSASAVENDNLVNGKLMQVRETDGAELTLSVKLLFDQVTNQDAFYADRLTPSVGSVATGIVQAVQAGKGKFHTVQPGVEGFLSAVTNRYTRIITFVWGDFSFRGILKGLNAQYTMFSQSGRPIRAEVDLRIYQKAGAAMLKNWQESYREAFSGGADFTTLSQKAGSFLNL